jgi:hypothetical protein
MITVYTGEFTDEPDPRMFFDLNAQNYRVVSAQEPNIDISLQQDVKGKLNLRLSIFHNYENQINELKNLDVLYITNAVDLHQSVRKNIIHNDFLFNRTCAYYFGYPWQPETQLWYHNGAFSFVNNRIEFADHKKKIFVAPNKTYNGSRRYRTQLVDYLKQFSSLGYLGNYDMEKSLFLYPHIEFPFIDSIEELEKQTRPMSYDWWGYCPPHNAYYNNTFISIYGETIEYGRNLAPTEKTYDPLIKGHFILPFSAPNFINYLKQLGFLFPNFIDYSYDSIEDNQQRYQCYQQEVQRVLHLSLNQWKDYWNNNIDLLLHNKRIFHDRGYDRVDLMNLLKKLS